MISIWEYNGDHLRHGFITLLENYKKPFGTPAFVLL